MNDQYDQYDQDDEYDVEVTCQVCGCEFECGSRDANAIAVPLCSTECEQAWPKVRDAINRERMAEATYRCGYEYACGYHD